MANSNGHIYIDTSTDPDTGVSLLSDIQYVLGLSSNDIGGLINTGAQPASYNRPTINKWAKFKPIHYPGKYRLEEGDFRGRVGSAVSDTVEANLVYGLEVPAQLTSIYPAKKFHEVTWDYKGYPNATGLNGASMYRFLDFDGYDQRAVADLSGQIFSTSKFYVGLDASDAEFSVRSSEVDVGYHKSPLSVSTYRGVELAKVLISGTADAGNMDDEDLYEALCNCYPAILIGDELSTGTNKVYYLTALTNIDDSDHETIMYDSGTESAHNYACTSTRWGVDFTRDDGDNPVLTSPVDTKATLLLLYFNGGDPYLVNGDSTTDVTDRWIVIDPSNPPEAAGVRFFPLPGASGIDISLTTYQNGIVATPVSASCTSQALTITADVTYSSQSTGGNLVFNATLGGNSAATATKELLISQSTQAATATITFAVSDFNGEILSFDNTNSPVLVSITASPGNNNRSAYLPFTIASVL